MIKIILINYYKCNNINQNYIKDIFFSSFKLYMHILYFIIKTKEMVLKKIARLRFKLFSLFNSNVTVSLPILIETEVHNCTHIRVIHERK